MADPRRRLPDNVAGPWFVDDSCINCGVSRHFAPGVFGDDGRHAYVRRQPAGEAETRAAMRALLSCPTGSIGVSGGLDVAAAMQTLPLALAPGVEVNGFNHRASYGAHSYLLRTAAGNWLIDAPRFAARLVRHFEEAGGVRQVLLTHRDDVADARRFVAHFGAGCIVHRADAAAAPFATTVLEGSGPFDFGEVELLHVPGHTPGHLVAVHRGRYLFSGDHLAWDPQRARLVAFPGHCWYSWREQRRSLAALARYADVEWVFPGHGSWGRLAPGDFPAALERLLAALPAA